MISLCSTQCEKKRNRRRQRRLIGIIIIPGRLIELMPVVPVLFFSCSTLLLLVSPYINLRLVYLLILFFFGFFSISWLRRHGFPWFVTGKVIHKTISRREIFTVDSQLSSALEVYVSCAQDFLFIPHIFLFSFVSIISCFSAAAPMRPWRLAGDGSARPDSKGKQQGNEEMKNGGGRQSRWFGTPIGKKVNFLATYDFTSILSPLYVGGMTKNQLRQIKNGWATHTHTQCTAVISFCFFGGFWFSRGNHDHPLSSSSTNEREKNSTDTQLDTARDVYRRKWLTDQQKKK